eukprot:1139485-Pelagomonas_calceolata.AAC.10
MSLVNKLKSNQSRTHKNAKELRKPEQQPPNYKRAQSNQGSTHKNAKELRATRAAVTRVQKSSQRQPPKSCFAVVRHTGYRSKRPPVKMGARAAATKSSSAVGSRHLALEVALQRPACQAGKADLLAC